MEDRNKTKEQLTEELAEMRKRVAQLEAFKLEQQQVEAAQERLLMAEREQRVLTEALHWAGAVLGSTLNYEKVLDLTLEQIGRVISCQAACIILLNGKIAQIFRWLGYSGFEKKGSFAAQPFDIGDIPALRTVRETGWSLAIPYVPDYNEWITLSNQGWIKSSICAPIRTRNRLIGFLQADHDMPGFYSQGDAERLHAFANQAAIALENARMYDQARQEIVRRIRALKKERNFVSAILDTVGALVMVLDKTRHIVLFNRACEQMTQYSFDEVKGKRPDDLFIPPEELELVEMRLEALYSGQHPVEYEGHWLTRAGEVRLIAWSSTVLFDRNSVVEYIVSTGLDITERRRAEEELKSSEERLKILFEFAPDAYYLIDLNGIFLDGNRAAETLSGYKREEVIGKDFVSLGWLSAGQLSVALELLAKGNQGEPSGPDELLLTRRDGSLINLEIRTFPTKIKGQELILGIARDISERKRAEEEQQQLIRELDAFAHTVAHDLKDPIAHIVGRADVLREYYASLTEADLLDSLQVITREGLKMSNIVDELLLLAGARTQKVELQPLDMAEIIEGVRQRLQYMIERYQAEIILPEYWPVALGYAPWVEEIWVNYLSNALKYGGQPVRVELGGRKGSEGQVYFWVHDNGSGLRPEEQKDLFTPFTRLGQARTKGYGLGLSIVRRIVERLGGEVGVESEGVPGEGSTFSFTLPGIDNDKSQPG